MASASPYWADAYRQKMDDAAGAIARIRPGQRVFIGSSCGEPQHLVQALSRKARGLADIEVVRLLSLEPTPLSRIADETGDRSLNIRSFYIGSGIPQHLAQAMRHITPLNLADIPRLFAAHRLQIQVALVQVSPPDDFGWMSLGVSVDITRAAALSAELVVAQVNGRMPRVLGNSFIHVNDVDVIVEHDEPLLAIAPPPVSPAARTIARHVARLVDDGATIQTGLGEIHQAVLEALAEKNDLGVHSQYLTDAVMHLVARGVITNRRKGLNDGKLVASSAIGSEIFYEFLDDNPAVEFHPSDYVNAQAVIAAHRRMVSLNVAMVMDLTGQVATDALAHSRYAGVNGMLDFVRGAAQAQGGKSILMITAASSDGTQSRIVPLLSDTVTVVPRTDVHYVVSQYGAVNLHGKSLQERAMAMISIAHPDFRGALFDAAKEKGFLGRERKLGESISGIYPLHLEEVLEFEGVQVVLRPAKPVDLRRIQEHYYALDNADIYARFMHARSHFSRDEIEDKARIDYVHNLTMLVVAGEFGFGQVVGLGEYLCGPGSNVAEIAFSVSRPWQGKGLGKRLLAKLAQAARENGIDGLTAYTMPENRRMIELFKNLPYKVQTRFEDGCVVLSCHFDTPA
jgi:acyl-CoA hydrolase/GNAT superfamily N-acetyltransferase